MTYRWLKGDLHCHCEQHELLPELTEYVRGRLDFLALTNHAHKPMFREQVLMVARVRELLPDTLVLFGLEWNGPGGRHTNVIFPPSGREAELALAFIDLHDQRLTGREPSPKAALDMLRAMPAAERPVVFANHPAPEIGLQPSDLDALLDDGEARVFVGIEALHGHQAWAHVAAMDALDYPASRVGGLCDHVYAQGRPFALLAHSDFHVHKQLRRPDWPPGAFNCTLAMADSALSRADSLFAALRAGRTCAAQGSWFDLRRFDISGAGIGERCPAQSDGELVLEADCAEPLRSLDLIGRLDRSAPVHLTKSFGAQPAGPLRLVLPVPAGARGFVRLRAVTVSERRPPPGTSGPRLFLSSAILLGPAA